MDWSVANLTLWLTGLGVVLLILLVIVAWFYLKNVASGIAFLNQDTRVFSDSAKSLSLDIKSLTLSLSALGQDIRNLNQHSSTLSQDIKTLNQDTNILSQNVDNLSGSVNGLISSQNKMTDTMVTVEKKQDDAAKSVDRISKHFAE